MNCYIGELRAFYSDKIGVPHLEHNLLDPSFPSVRVCSSSYALQRVLFVPIIEIPAITQPHELTARLRCFSIVAYAFGSKSKALWDTVYKWFRDLGRGFLEISCQNYQKCIYSVILTVETELCTRTTDEGSHKSRGKIKNLYFQSFYFVQFSDDLRQIHCKTKNNSQMDRSYSQPIDTAAVRFLAAGSQINDQSRCSIMNAIRSQAVIENIAFGFAE